MSDVIKEIKSALSNGSLTRQFTAGDCRNVIHGFAKKTFSTFLPKHCEDNPGGYAVYFRRVGKGRYELLP